MKAQHRRVLLCVSLALAALVALLQPDSLAHADESADDDPSALFEQGKADYSEGRYEQAYQAYKKAWDLRPSYDVAGNLGNVELKTGRYADAIEHLRYALDNLPPSLERERREEVESGIKRRLDEARAHVGTLHIETPDGASIFVNDRAVGQAPLDKPIYLEKGRYQIRAEPPGATPVTQWVDVAPGREQRVVLQPKAQAVETSSPAAEPPPTPPSPVEQGDTTGPSTPVVVTGSVLAAVGAGVGIALMIVSANKSKDADAIVGELGGRSSCVSPGAPADRCGQIHDLATSAVRLRAGGIAGLAAGGALAVATVVYALWPRGGDESAATVHVAPQMSSNGAFVWAWGNF